MPLIMMIRRILFCLSILTSSHSLSLNFQHEFKPRLSIPKNSEHSIQIKADQTYFYSRFLHEEKKLADIEMPFQVISTYSQPFLYSLSLQRSEHECSTVDASGAVIVEEFTGIEVQLTGPEGASWLNNTSIQADGENEHVMTLVFPETPPSGTLKKCLGFVSLQLELVMI